MELSAKYVYEVYRERSFSAAAAKIFISQPALSSSVSRLEKSLGFKIFDRSSTPLTLTPEGKIYIQSLEEIIESEENMRKRIEHLSDMSYGNISLGGGSYSSYFILPALCKDFHEHYPKIQITFDMGSSAQCERIFDKLRDNKVDLLLTYSFDQREFDGVPIFKERLFIAVNSSLVKNKELLKNTLTKQEILSGSYDAKKEIRDFTLFSDIPFIEYSKASAVTKIMVKLFGSYKKTNYSISNIIHSGVHFNLMRAGIGALMANETLIRTLPAGKNTIFFALRSDETVRDIYLVKKKGRELSFAASKFLELSKRDSSAEAIRDFLTYSTM